MSVNSLYSHGYQRPLQMLVGSWHRFSLKRNNRNNTDFFCDGSDLSIFLGSCSSLQTLLSHQGRKLYCNHYYRAAFPLIYFELDPVEKSRPKQEQSFLLDPMTAKKGSNHLLGSRNLSLLQSLQNSQLLYSHWTPSDHYHGSKRNSVEQLQYYAFTFWL